MLRSETYARIVLIFACQEVVHTIVFTIPVSYTGILIEKVYFIVQPDNYFIGIISKGIFYASLN